MDTANLIENLLLNLITEGIGIAVAVLIIDRIIQRREEKRWRPVKDAIKASIYGTVQDALSRTLPTSIAKGAKYHIYQFGDSYAQGFVKLSEDDFFELPRAIAKQNSLAEGTASPDIAVDFRPMFLAKQKIDETTSASVFALEPELIKLLFDFDLSLKNLNKYEKPDADFIAVATEDAIKIGLFLEAQAKRRFTMEEYIAHIIPKEPKDSLGIKILKWLRRVIPKP